MCMMFQMPVADWQHALFARGMPVAPFYQNVISSLLTETSCVSLMM